MSANLDAIFDVLANNSADVEIVVRQFGGIGNLARAAPALFRIAKTISTARDANKAAEHAADTLTYAEAIKPSVADFQRKYGLRADGLVGRETWSMIEQLLAHMEKDK